MFVSYFSNERLYAVITNNRGVKCQIAFSTLKGFDSFPAIKSWQWVAIFHLGKTIQESVVILC